jgi:hypothetical protein
LRTLEPYANVDFGAVGQDMVTLSQNMSAINQQIDQLQMVSTGNLAMLSNQLRGLEAFSDTNLGTISQDIVTLSQNVATITTRVEESVALIDQYIAIVDNLNLTIEQTQTNLDSQLALAKTVIFVAFLWILLAQLAPLYLGWELVSGQRNGSYPERVTEAPAA